MNKHDRIYIAGHNGMVGSAIVRALEASGSRNLLYRSSSELDLRDQAATKTFFEQERPDYVFLAAAKVGGIHANNIYRAEFLYDNLMIEANVIEIHALSQTGEQHTSQASSEAERLQALSSRLSELVGRFNT
mgnify:CR=1 FL=1